MNRDELIVIGSGGSENNTPGMGMRIGLLECDDLGGTHLNYGCDPTKTLFLIAHLLYHAHYVSAMGLCIPRAGADRPMVKARVRKIQEFICNDLPKQDRASVMVQGIDLFIGEARITTAEKSEQPKRLVVIGSGCIGLEFAQMFSRFGVKVVVVEGENQLIKREDPDQVLSFLPQLSANGLCWYFGSVMWCADISPPPAKTARIPPLNDETLWIGK